MRWLYLFAVSVLLIGCFDVNAQLIGGPSFQKVGILSLVAGSVVSPGKTDSSVSTDARFDSNAGVAVDSSGNVFVADTGNHTIRKISSAGVVTTFAGSAGISGTADGIGAAARFNSPAGIVIDGSGNLYVADSMNHTIRKITSAGVVTTFAGGSGVSGSIDSAGTAARFYFPRGIAIDGNGNLYIADARNNKIRKVTPDAIVTTVAGTGASGFNGDGILAIVSRLHTPYGVAIDSSGVIYIADTLNARIRKIATNGIISTISGNGTNTYNGDGTLPTVAVGFSYGIAVDSSSNVYIADTANNCIRKVDVAGMTTTVAGSCTASGSADGTGASAKFNSPMSVATDSSGNIFVADTSNHTVRKVTSAGVTTTLAGIAPPFGTVDGSGPIVRFNSPKGAATDSSGNIYLADTNNHTIRKISPSGVATTYAGVAGVPGYGGDSGPATSANFNAPSGVAVDSVGNVYVSDTGNRRIRKIASDGTVTTFAGSGVVGNYNDTGALAKFSSPRGIAVDSSGNIYVADVGNHNIRKITAAGAVSTLAGAGGVAGSVDGTGTIAQFNNPSSVAVDGQGNVYVADTGNHTIRKITADGTASTFAGLVGVIGSTDGSGGSARFYSPTAIAVDSSGVIYVADTNNHIIRRISPAGVVLTIAGKPNGSGIFLGPRTGLSYPRGLAVFKQRIYIVSSNSLLLFF